MPPKITIITPTYNSGKVIADCLESVAAQRYPDIEHWIIDGLSTDDTISIVKQYQERYPFISYITEPDKGIYDAMNKGISLAQGDYIYFMGGDDVFYNNDVLNKIFGGGFEPGIDLVYGKVRYKYSGKIYGKEVDLLTMMKERYNIPHQAVFYAKHLFDTIGKYDLKHPIYADFDYNIRCFKDDRISKRYTDQIIAIYNERGISNSSSVKNDSFYDELLKEYVMDYEDPIALFREKQQIAEELRLLKMRYHLLERSKANRLGNLILGPVKKIYHLFKKPV